MKFFIIGGSTTHGKGDPEYGGWSGLLRKHVETKNQNDTVFVLGIPSETTKGIKNRITNELISRYASSEDICIICLGLNDSRMDKESNCEISLRIFENNCNEIISQVRKITKNIVIIEPSNVNENKTNPFKGKYYKNSKIEEYKKCIRNICNEQDVYLVKDPKKEFSEKDFYDGLHPNRIEHKRRFKLLLEFLKQIKLYN